MRWKLLQAIVGNGGDLDKRQGTGDQARLFEYEQPVGRSEVDARRSVAIGAGEAALHDHPRGSHAYKRMVGSLAMANLGQNGLALIKSHRKTFLACTEPGSV